MAGRFFGGFIVIYRGKIKIQEWDHELKSAVMGERENIRQILKDELLCAHKQEIKYAKDCQILSLSIRQKTKRQISVTTLKRLFGIVPSRYNPSKYTLDSLAIYLDYLDWDDLKNSKGRINPEFLELDHWSLLKNRIQTLTDRSLSSLKTKLGDQFLDFPLREFAVNKFEAFLNSPQSATAFIAPEGYGKTSIVTQLVELFFTGPYARYPNDIVCLVDGSILVNLIDLDLEVVRVKNIVDFQQRKSFSVYFRKHPEQVKGRFVLIIESLYQVYHQEYRLNQFVENLMDILSAYEDVSWFKLLITCRPDAWKSISNLIQKDPVLKSKWFDVQIGASGTDSINVPLLSEEELMCFLNKRHSVEWIEQFRFHYPDVAEVYNKPYMLQLFSANPNPQGSHTDLDILDFFVSSKILIEPYLEEKSVLISSFFKLSNYVKQGSTVNKADLPAGANFDIAYKDLVFNNVFYEFNIRGSYLSVKTHVKFSNDILQDFFLANKWIEENGFDFALLRKVSEFYESNPMSRTNLLKCLIKMAFKENRIDILRDIFTLFESAEPGSEPPDESLVNQEIINTIGIELRKNEEAREFLIPLYAQSKLGQLLYFESFFDMDSLVLHSGDSINFYLENKHSDEARIYGHFLKFMQYFLSGERPACKNEYVFFQKFKLPEQIDPALAAYYYGAQLIYQCAYEAKADQNMLKEVFLTSGLYFKRGTQSEKGIPIFEYILIYALNYGSCFKEIIKLSNLTIRKYRLDSTNLSWRHQLFLLIFARALLNSGEVEKALTLYRKVKLQNIPVNYKYYVRLRSSLIRVEFLVFENKIEKAQELIEEMKTISRMIRHKYFYDLALLWETQLH